MSVKVADALREAAAGLERAGCPSPRVDAEWLLADVLGTTRTGLYVTERPLEEGELRRFRGLVERRGTREPLAYVLGEWGFRRLTLAVDPRVLIPRPETEIVVERCLELLRPIEQPRVLDIGVGSGAIALAIADERSGARVVATDSSADALAVAEANKARLALNGRVELRQGDLLAGARGPFDLVVSNPPYVAPEDVERLAPEVLHEPRGALVGSGRQAEVAEAARAVLSPAGIVVLEVGDGQAPEVTAALEALGYGEIRTTPDLAGRERVVEGRVP
ncbi:MAG TPA: peptide chain release factor N(5)-glutamine methyltransferase [Gaiellaceae bacterium]|nr:peptide chain release factor N(5)-glutamine methyltransferase [Gaiellaceae bacterium]